MKRILIPYDFSETSAAAVEYGLGAARTFGARVVLLHVGTQAHEELGLEFPLGLEGAVEDAVRERLLRILTPAEQREFKPELAVRPGVPAAEIVQYARDQKIDLIVMGTHGRGFVGHFVMGSVAETVVRTAPCPVLTVRNPRDEAAVRDAAAAPRVA